MSRRPYSVLQFAVSAPSSQLVEPPAEIRNSGFATGTRPPAQWLNYMMSNSAQWIDRLRSASRSRWTRTAIATTELGSPAVDAATDPASLSSPARRMLVPKGTGGKILASVRGDSLTELMMVSGPDTAVLCACASNTGWLVGGAHVSITQGRIVSTTYDPDAGSAVKNPATAWTVHTIPVGMKAVTAIVCRTSGPSAGDAVAVVNDAQIVVRTGATTWAYATTAVALGGNGSDVCDTGQQWIFVDTSGIVFRSSWPSAITFAVATTLPSGGAWRLACDDRGTVVAYRAGLSTVEDWAVSHDHGLTWAALTPPSYTKITRIRYLDGTWLLGSEDWPYVAESNDLTTWQSCPVPYVDGANHRINDFAVIDGGIIAVGSDHWLTSARGEVVAPGPWSPAGTSLPIADAGYLQGRPIDSTAPTSGQTLVWDSTISKWKPGAGGGASLPAGALGSLLVHDGLAWVSLGVGTTGQVLRVVSGEPKWATLAAGDVGAIPTPGTPISGGLLYYAGSWQSTAAGSARQVLTSAGAGAPVWGADVVPLTQRAVDGLGTSVTVCATLAHDLNAGGGGDGIGARCELQARNSASTLVAAAAVDGVLTTATAGSEVGVLDVRVRDTGALARVARFASSSLRLDWAARALTVLANDGTTLDVWRVDGSNYWCFGSTNGTNSSGTIVYTPAAGDFYLYRGGNAHIQLASGGTLTLGTTTHPTVLRGSTLTIGLTSVVAQYQGGARVPERTLTTSGGGSSYTLDAQDEVVFVDTTLGVATITLPAGASGRILSIQRIAGSNSVVVQRAGSDTICAGGSGSLTSWTIVDGARHGLIYRSGGTEWVAEA